MSNTRLFHQEIIVPENIDHYLRNLYAVHTVLRNYMLKILVKEPKMEFKEIKALVRQYIKDNDLQITSTSSVFNELYYRYKRFQQDNAYTYKEGKQIQYITYKVHRYVNYHFTIKNTEMTLREVPGKIILPYSPPSVTDDGKTIYVNIGYYAKYKRYQLSIFH